MTRKAARRRPAGRAAHGSRLLACALSVLGLGLDGCGAFNPAFLSVVTPGTGSSGVQNVSGHVIVTVINNAEIDERLVAYLAPRLDLTEAEIRNLRPRTRMRLLVTFTDNTTQTLEFITGSSEFVDPSFDAESAPDLNENDLETAVVLCDVASVQLEPGSAIEVFVPVNLTGFELVESQTEGGQTQRTFEPRTQTPPQFRVLQTDDVDEDGNTALRRNIGVRDTVAPVTNLQCGSVIGIVVTGVLSVPFLDGVSDDPSFDQDDEQTVAGIGGRYAFRASVQ